jgi:hypothetical protein
VNGQLKHHSRSLLVALLLALGAGGCAMTFDSTSLGVPATMAAAASQAVVGDTFKVTDHALYGLWGLVAVRQPKLQATLEAQLAGGRAVQNLRIHVRRRLVDVLVTALSAGLLSPVSVTFEGIIAPRAP